MPNLFNALLRGRDDEGIMAANDVIIAMPYDPFDQMGVATVVVTAGISLLCVVFLLSLLGTSLFKQRHTQSGHFFVRTHAAAYFTCLLVADMIQAVATLMSIKWIQASGITLEPFCSFQGALKNAGNLSVSLWSLVLAIHVFCVLFLRWKPKDWALYTTLMGVWLLVGLIVVIGPGIFEKIAKGPYFGVAGYWCWISNTYQPERIVFEYFWMFASAGISFVLYTWCFLYLRGNIQVHGGRVRFCRINSHSVFKYQISRDSTDMQMTAVVRGMIGFPILFTITVLPIAVCRFVAWSGKSVPVEATIFSDAIFSLTGVFDLLIFMSTRPLLPSKGIVPWWFTSRAGVSEEVREYGVQPYNVKDFVSAHGFDNEKNQSQPKNNMVTLPPRTTASLKRSGTSRSKRPLSLTHIPTSGINLSRPPQRYGGNRMTVNSRYSQDDNNLEHAETPPLSGWDEVDLGRQGTVNRSTFGSPGSSYTPPSRAHERDTRYTTFSLSAYGYDRDSAEMPPFPPGIDAGGGRDRDRDRNGDRDDSDDPDLTSGRSRDNHRDRYASGMSYDMPSPDIRPPQRAARRF